MYNGKQKRREHLTLSKTVTLDHNLRATVDLELLVPGSQGFFRNTSNT